MSHQKYYPHSHGNHMDSGPDMHMDHGDTTPVVVNPREVQYNYCDREKCYWHWKGREARVKDVGVCTKNWAVDRSILPKNAKCPHYSTEPNYSNWSHADSI